MTLGAMTRQTRVAWLLVGLSGAGAVVHTWLFLGWSAARQEPSGWPILTVGVVLSAALGALIVSRRPGHRIGWLFVIAGAMGALGNTLIAYDAVATSAAGAEPSHVWQWARWIALILDAPVPTLMFILLFLLFPDGQLASRRWRPLLWAGVTAASLFVVVVAVDTPPWQIRLDNEDDPFGPVALPILVALLITLVLLLLGAAASVVVRLRHAQGLERQQLRWLAAAASLVAVGFAIAVVLPWQEGARSWLRVLPLHIGILCFIVGAGLAVLRYRLYDLDIVVSRAILLATATVFVVAGYVVVVVVIGQALPTPSEGRFWPSLLATAIVALAFQPLRVWAVRLADRIAYGQRAAPYEALASFARRLQDAPDPTGLLQQVSAAVGEAVGARQVTAVLELPEHGDVRSIWQLGPSSASGAPAVLAIRDRGDELGRVEIVMTPGVSLRQDETDLVERLLTQSAVALRNLRLETELAAQVAELDRRTTALAASRRQIVEAGDEANARFSLALRRRVLPHLAPLPERLESIGRRSAAGLGADLDLAPEQAAATEALDELRRLVHGMGPAVDRRAARERASARGSQPG
jgi:hypothetical protein